MSVRVLERIEVFTPLGLRFWDPVLDRAIVDGLHVSAWPAQRPSQVVTAVKTRSSVYAFRWLPDMRPVEHLIADPDFFDASVPGQRPFVIAVRDPAERFLPVAFQVLLPLPYRGVFLESNDVSPFESAPAAVHLFSAPTRRASERLAAVRGTLVDADSGNRASWATVRISAPHGGSYYGLADAEGRFAVMFPFPSLAEGFDGSPASFGHGSPVADRGWDISVRVNYEPNRLTRLLGTDIPEYRSILGQRQGSLWNTAPGAGSQAVEKLDVRLAFGQELILRTSGLHLQLVEPSLASP